MFGAAASIVIVLIWVYYSAQLVLFGAELTNVRAKQRRGAQTNGVGALTRCLADEIGDKRAFPA